MVMPLDHASTDLIKSLEALQSIEAKLVDHGRISEAMHIVRLSDDEHGVCQPTCRVTSSCLL